MIEKHLLKKISEGKTSFYIFSNDKENKRGPGKKQGFPFYNSSMRMNRDISILVLQYFINQKDKLCYILDGMAASGVRSFRFLNEVTGNFHVTINDSSDEAYRLIKKNADKYDKKKLEITHKNIYSLLAEKSYDYIDIDPFGSPAIYIDSALRSIKNNGIIAISATDTATLCGVFPNVCKRRYNANPLHGACMHETALRILLGFVGRQAGKYDKGIDPLLSYSTDHYLRCYVMIKKGVKYSNCSINHITPINGSLIPGQNDKYLSVGPLWTGFLSEQHIIRKIIQILFKNNIQTKKQTPYLLSLLEQESIMPAFYYSTNILSKYLKKNSPRLDYLIELLQKKGFVITKTHFEPSGFKTNAPREVVEELFLNSKL
jgi:tRNA (guanine26-N2/guanine27-N2)-dimethyltransferase